MNNGLRTRLAEYAQRKELELRGLLAHVNQLGFCNHGDWKGPCSNAKHDAIRAGINPHFDKVKSPISAAFEAFKYAVQLTVTLPDGIYCKCCKYLYVAF